jgi:hypothetical protein
MKITTYHSEGLLSGPRNLLLEPTPAMPRAPNCWLSDRLASKSPIHDVSLRLPSLDNRE